MPNEISRRKTELFYDLRLRDKLMTEGKISKSEVDSFLQALPDDSANVEKIGEKSSNANKKNNPVGSKES